MALLADNVYNHKTLHPRNGVVHQDLKAPHFPATTFF